MSRMSLSLLPPLVAVLLVLPVATAFVPPSTLPYLSRLQTTLSPPTSTSNYISRAPSPATQLKEAMYPWEGPLRDEEMLAYKEEETLLKLHCRILDNVELEQAMAYISKYVQSFPFAAVLPVQPLQYLPTSDGGVQVTFLRKKTKEKGSVDGGLRFFVVPDKDTENDTAQQGLEIVVKRYSEGQTVSKMFAEKLVVLAFVEAFTGQDTQQKYGTKGPPTIEHVTVESVFHKWMEL